MCILVLATTNALAGQSATLKGLLLSPGELSAAHQDLADKCDACHAEFSRREQDGLCLSCHEAVAADLHNRKRFHGLHPAASCDQCHTEHQGKAADIVGMDVDMFDHRETGFPLAGAHASLACNQCHDDKHRAGNKLAGSFRIEKKACADCHADPHDGALQGSCDSCHSSEGWRQVKFNHDDTKFALRDKHATLLCQACHQDKKFEAPLECVSCHRADDVHHGAMGEDCTQCHSSKGWRQVKFDHEKTHFPLHGAHSGLQCSLCHTQQGNQFEKLFGPMGAVKNLCSNCHARDDIHQGAFGAQCDKCHDDKDWRNATFDHGHASFTLEGRHKSLPCAICHAAGTPVNVGKPRSACIDCHGSDDVHHGQLGEKCDSCHVVSSPWQRTTFDHDFTAFPLTGAHRELACEGCHQNQQFGTLADQCSGCHQVPAVHKTVFTKDCAQCHSTRDWRVWQFNHAATSFDLEGAHRQVACLDCHQPKLGNPLKPGTSCFACHAEDDVHHREFGQRCESCHTASSFKDARVGGRVLH